MVKMPHPAFPLQSPIVLADSYFWALAQITFADPFSV
jgi:hypothetical protein